MKPMNIDYPMQIELLSRSLGLIDLPEDAVITPIPTDEDLSSLSAILMDDEYYHFLLITVLWWITSILQMLRA